MYQGVMRVSLIDGKLMKGEDNLLIVLRLLR